jgi:hypothetical protein
VDLSLIHDDDLVTVDNATVTIGRD